MRIEFLCGYKDTIEDIELNTEISKEKLSTIVRCINVALEEYGDSLTDSEWITVLLESAELAANVHYVSDNVGRPMYKSTSPEKAVEQTLAKVIQNSIIPDKYQRKM